MKKVTMSLELARQMYDSGNEEMKAFALENYPELDKSQLPLIWEDVEDKFYGFVPLRYNGKVEKNDVHNSYYLNFVTKEQAQAAIALAKLSRLREIYRQGWKPDWSVESQRKYCIKFYEDRLLTGTYSSSNAFLSFQDSYTAELFLENFRDLIEQAKPLMS
jgi:hypothetical protein